MSIQRIIDGVPSEEFYSGFHYTKILRLLGCDGDAKPGTYVRCPKCKTPSMLISELAPFGGWMHCDKCKLSCEGLRLYGQAYKISNPETLIDRLAEDLKLKDVPAEDLVNYCKFYHRRYNQINKVWELAKAQMSPNINRFAASRLSELNLWLNQDGFNRTFVDWFGYSYKHEIEELLDAKVPGPSKTTEGLLIMPFYLKPGFIAGFGFIGAKDQMSYLNLLDGQVGGICGLNSCHLDKSTCVYVLPHPLQAARIIHKCGIERYNKLSVVAKSPLGAFDPLTLPKEAVVWTEGEDTQFLKTCIKPKGFKVMVDDTPYIWKPTEKASKLWEGSFMPRIHKQVLGNTLLDPVDFLIGELLGIGIVNARNLVEAMELTEFQKNLILASCTEEIIEEMTDILAKVASSKPIIIDKKVVFERAGKLWASGSRELGDEVLCDATMRITHICRGKEDGEASLFGRLTFEGKEVDFQLSEELLEFNPAKALIFLTANAGIAKQPFLEPTIAKRYLDIILRLNPPEVHSVQAYVGFDPGTNRFNLPRLSIDSNQIRAGVPFVMGVEEPPCSNISIDPGVTVSSIGGIFEYGPETVAYLAAMTSVITGILDLVHTKERTNTLLVGGKGSLAEYIFDIVRIDLGLETILLQGKDDFEAAQAVAQLHQVPVAIDGNRSKPKLLAQWLEGQGNNSLVVANSLTASALAADKDWTFVRADIPFSDDTRALLRSENVFPFFMQYALTVKPNSAKSLLDHLKYLAKSMNRPLAALEAAKSMLSTQGYINCRSDAVHLINFIHEGVENGMFKTFTGETSKKRYVVLKNPMEDVVAIDLANLLGQMRYYNLPVVLWESSVAHLKSLGVQEVTKDDVSFLVFPKPVWNTLVTAVKRMRGMRKRALTTLLLPPAKDL